MAWIVFWKYLYCVLKPLKNKKNIDDVQTGFGSDQTTRIHNPGLNTLLWFKTIRAMSIKNLNFSDFRWNLRLLCAAIWIFN